MDSSSKSANPFDFSLSWPDSAEVRSPTRSAALDLVKWLALLTMLLDHLRFVWPDLSGLFVPGRIAFPLFCLAIAANVHRTQRGEVLSPANRRYAASLLAFALISEIPHRLLVGADSATVNVLPTLTLGLVVAWGIHHRTASSVVLAVLALAVSIALERWIMYGVLGVLLPAALLMAIGRPCPTWMLPAAIFLLANCSMELLAAAAAGELYPLLLVGALIGAPLLGLWLLDKDATFPVPQVGRWGYWFYPAHMLALCLARWLHG
ncbi:TraX family protein [Pseudomonas aeruginosa]|uniref:TraX family protein n=1 Tax=Pseudomonas aeruginosa TaxID=287 RepID=UPI000F52B761|nr:TraX family protein [Pseudomonas aeruginosa]RQG73514.1 conjugal transfer protein TraX [Pseudomonas aeruginosa]